MKLSLVVSTYNSQEVLIDCLRSVKSLASEIIIIDNGSSDDTVKIAKTFTKKIFSHKNNPLMLNQAKNYGFTKAQSKWILNLDPDERLSPTLLNQIKKAIKKENHEAYQFPRKNIIFGKWIKHGLWYPDEQIRLFQKNQAKFPLKHNHEKIQVNGSLGSLSGHLIHYNYTSVTQYIDKINHAYSDAEAQALIDSGKRVYWYDAIRMPLSDFLANFFAREAYKDGLHGLSLSIFQAFYTFVVFAKVWEKQKFTPYTHKSFLRQCKIEFLSKLKEFEYWYYQKQGLKSGSAGLKKLTRKIWRKIKK